MMKKLLWLCLAALSLSMPAHAVLKEKDLSKTLAILRTELENYQKEQAMRSSHEVQRDTEMRNRTIATMQNSSQTALMLYSQKMDYIFDLTYACNQATQQYEEYGRTRMPFDKIIAVLEQDTARYNGMIKSLSHLPVGKLDSKAITDRDVCLTLATCIYKEKVTQLSGLKEDQQTYEMVSERLERLKDYANKRYKLIRENIFVNGDNDYFTVLANFTRYWRSSKEAINFKYKTKYRVRSEWSGMIILGLFGFVLFYGLLSVLLNVLAIRFLMPRRFRSPEFLKKRTCIILASTVVTFGVVVCVLRYFVLTHNFLLMAAGLLTQYAWLLGAILISLLVRLTGDQIKSGFRIYLPIMAMGFIVIAFRIVLIPNELVNLVFPPILLICAFWQWNVIHRHNKNIPKSDVFYTWISFAVMVASVIIAWVGYTLLSVQLLIWWIMQLTCIQTITCIYDLLSMYEKKHIKEDADITKTWVYDFISKALVPITGAFSLMISIYWAAQVFDLTEWCHDLFTTDFVSSKDAISISMLRICVVVALWFVFHYAMYLLKSLLIHHFSDNEHINGQGAIVIGKNLLYIVIWGAYLLIVMKILNMGNSWILVITGGLSTGIGFAMKDTLENLFYGLSLMSGRVHIGDTIECDGVRGTVKNINYQSTMLETIDGSEMAFLNSQLFSKNFKNLTHNHGFELVKLPVGVAYGSNVEDVRKCILDRLSELDCYSKTKGLSVAFSGFGDNSVDLLVVAWVPVLSKPTAMSRIKEAIYEALNEAHIEIPFPQRDIYVKQMPTFTPSVAPADMPADTPATDSNSQE